MFILVDCNNFFVSCERVFVPRLERKPVIVLSNNDGCVISRSAEAKSLGIGMGEPFFKIKDFCLREGVVVFSSNFALYGSISNRIMRILHEEASEVEEYSIDEAFLRIQPNKDLFDYAKNLRNKIKTWTEIPTSLGIGPTKTLAKVATKIAKKSEIQGVFDISPPSAQKDVLRDFPVGDIWGIGKKTDESLHKIGITTALQFCEADSQFIQKKYGITGERIQLELRGTNCFSFNEMSLKKTILCSQSFSSAVTNAKDLSLALSAHIQEACETLRTQQSFARAGEVFVEVKNTEGLRDHLSASFYLPFPANDTPTFLTVAKESLFSILHNPFYAKRCGILLFDFVQEENLETDLFWKGLNPQKRKLMALVDFVNGRFGKNTLFYASTHARNSSWRSPRYTTCWDELALVKAT